MLKKTVDLVKFVIIQFVGMVAEVIGFFFVILATLVFGLAKILSYIALNVVNIYDKRREKSFLFETEPED